MINIKNLQKKKEIAAILTLIFFSFIISWHFGFIAINPFDNFIVYNSANLILDGKTPFKDYWLTQGLLLDLIQYVIFSINGVSWNGYVFHSSLFNSLYSTFLYYVFRKFDLNIKLSFLYSICAGLIFYPQLGVPYMEYHSYFFSLFALLTFILALNFNTLIYWFLIPLFFILGFLSKQTPVGYFFIIVSFFIIYNFIFHKNVKIIFILFFSSVLFIFIFYLYLFLNNIELLDFYNQYIKFPSSIGKNRMESDAFLKPINFSRYFLKFKWLHLSYLILIIILFKNIKKDKNFLTSKDFITGSLLILSVYVLIIHQLLTLNSKFIYFYIPVLCAFNSVYLNKYATNRTKLYKIFNIIILLTATTYYFSNYVYHQKFQLYCWNKTRITNAFSTTIIDNNNNFLWVDCIEQKPETEIANIKKIIEFLDLKINKKDNYVLVTDYQFINSILKNKNAFQLNHSYHIGVSYPDLNNIKFNYFKNFLKKQITKYNIKFFVFVYPSLVKNSNQLYFEEIFKLCSDKFKYLNGSIEILKIDNCFK